MIDVMLLELPVLFLVDLVVNVVVVVGLDAGSGGVVVFIFVVFAPDPPDPSSPPVPLLPPPLLLVALLLIVFVSCYEFNVAVFTIDAVFLVVNGHYKSCSKSNDDSFG